MYEIFKHHKHPCILLDVWGKRILFICDNKDIFPLLFLFIPFTMQLFSILVTSSKLC